jgi:nucleotidyltransferase AbiEii toxin of type IV toxin-antitoxin system
MQRFAPRLDILPAPQRRLWPELCQIPKDFVLYGGTAIALRLAHRSSVDFDFFTSRPFQPASLLANLPLLSGAKVLQNVSQTLTVLLERDGGIKLSFGGLPLGRAGEPEESEDEVIAIASLLDLAGTKAAVITQRAEAKDYVDILALMRAGIDLPQAMAAARAIYGNQYNPLITLKSLTYFGDGDLHKLTEDQRSTLTKAATHADIELPKLARTSDSLSPVRSSPWPF